MSLRTAAIAACAAFCAVPAARAAGLTLDDAFERAARQHPELRLLEARGEVLTAERAQAAQRPGLVAGIDVENVLGTDDLSGARAGELTFTLGSVLERGDKRDARQAMAQRRIDALAVERDARRLDLLAEVARRYLSASASLQARSVADLEIGQRQRVVDVARSRFEAGASPEAIVLTARASLARAELARARADLGWTTARQHLAALWSDRTPQFDLAAGDLLALPAIPERGALARLLEQTPELTRFAGARRVAEARVQLARSAREPDVQWQVGLRGLNASNDVGLVAGFQVPLGTRRRAEPELQAARTELSMIEVEREAGEMALYATLVDAHGQYQLAQLETARLRDEIIPALVSAESAAERAWRAGASTYLEWSQLQSELTEVRRQQLEVAVNAHRALIEIQRLTGQAFVAGPAIHSGNAP